jgi:hypothetical protein
MGYVIAATFLIGLIAALMAFYFFDFVVKEQHDDHALLWEKSGRPWGFYWAPDGWRRLGYFKRLASVQARGRCIYRWLFFAPDWISPQSRQKLNKFRIAIAVMLAAFSVTFALIVTRTETFT